MASVVLQGTSYAVGLWWQLHNNPEGSRKLTLKKARADALKFTDSHFTSVAITSRQYALGSEQYLQDTYALAASLQPDTNFAQGFVGIFNFDTGWWVCGVCNAIVAAEGDQFFSSEAEARKHAKSLAELFSDTKEVVCTSFAESQAYLEPLLHVGPLVSPLTVQAAPRKKSGLSFKTLLAMAFVFALGLWTWNTLNDEEVKKDIYRYFIGEAEYAELIHAKNTTYFPRLWHKEPSVNDVERLCFDAILSVPLISHGWEQQSVVCTPSQLIVEWAYRPEASFLTLPAFATLLNPKQAKSVVSLPKLPARSNPSPSAELFGRKETTLYFYEMTRLLRCKLSSMRWDAKGARTIDGVMLRSPFVVGSWELTDIPAAFVPDTLFMYLSQFKELSITEIVYRNAKWTVKGKVYVNASKP